MPDIPLSGSLKLVTSEKEITKQILNAIAEELNKRFLVIRTNLLNKLRQSVRDAIESTPEYKSLNGGKLQAELGVTNAGNKLEVIVGQWISNINVHIVPLRYKPNGLSGGLSIRMNTDDYSSVLDLPEAIYTTNKGEKIEWLRWLLLEGDKIIIRNYQIGVDHSRKSRTGLGRIMVRGNVWRVPPEYAGTANNNFITRALLTIDIDRIVEEELNR